MKQELFSKTVRLDLGEGQRDGIALRQKISLEDSALEQVELCFDTASAAGNKSMSRFFLAIPRIRSMRARLANTEESAEKLNEVQKRHLKALGYVD